KSHLVNAVWAVAIVLNGALDYLAVQLGLGLVGVAAGGVIAQAITLGLFFATIDVYVCVGWEERLKFYGPILGLLAVSVGLYVLFQTPRLSSANADLLMPTLWRVLGVILGWGAAVIRGLIFWRARSR